MNDDKMLLHQYIETPVARPKPGMVREIAACLDDAINRQLECAFYGRPTPGTVPSGDSLSELRALTAERWEYIKKRARFAEPERG